MLRDEFKKFIDIENTFLRKGQRQIRLDQTKAKTYKHIY